MPPLSSSVVVVDTSVLISLDVCNKIQILAQLYSTVLVPRAVERELSVGGTTALPKGLTRAHRKWIKVRRLIAPAPEQLTGLGPGEAEVIALALEIGCPLVLLDEPPARLAARAMGLQILGTAGVLIRAKNQGLLPEIRPLIELMRSKNVRLGDSLVDSTLRKAGEKP